MRYVAILGIVCLGAMSWLSGCSDGTGTSGSDGAGGSSAMSTSSSGGGMGSSSSGEGGSMASSSSSSGGMMLNGCDSSMAEDLTANATNKVTFGADLKYTPACIRVKKGSSVTFEGDFALHPLVGGEASLPPKPDGSSPIKNTTGGTSATFTMDLAGTYPYYCEYHFPSMAGVVYVE